jgi:three-Cys-motif partner protein
MEPESIGLWTEIKLHIIQEYAAAYTTILKDKSWCRSYAYVDAFAGGGEFVAKEDARRLISGSPLNALNIPNKFSLYYFIDIDLEKIARLKELVANRTEIIKTLNGDANQILQQEILPDFQYNSFKRALCILDPYGIDIEWATIHACAEARTMDIFLNFPLMDINRNGALKKLETNDPSQGSRLTRIWGDESWKDLAYTEQPRLFNDPILVKKSKGNEILKNGFIDRLKNVAGYKFVPEPALMRNSVGGPLYYLFFASHQPVAQDIVEDIFAKHRGNE